MHIVEAFYRRSVSSGAARKTASEKIGEMPDCLFLRCAQTESLVEANAEVRDLILSFYYSVLILFLHRLNHPCSFTYSLLLSLWCFSISVNYYFQVSLN